VFILEVLKVLCFDTLLQVFILKVDSAIAGALAKVLALPIVLQTVFLGNVGRKGVRWLAGYFMGYYTIRLAPVKRYFVPFWELGKKHSGDRIVDYEPKAAAPGVRLRFKFY
jgi:hypothetical protein